MNTLVNAIPSTLWRKVTTSFLLLVFLSLNACKTIDVNSSGIIHPKPANATVDSKVERVAIKTQDGKTIRGYFLASETAKFNIIWFGSSKAAVEDTMPFLLEYRQRMNANILAMNFRGYADSEGTPDWDELFSDGTLVVNYMRQRPEAKAAPIALHGFSLGSFVALKVAAQEQDRSTLSAVIIQGSGTNIDEWIDLRTPWYFKPFVKFNIDPKLSKLNSLDVVSKFTQPFLIMSGELDTDAPHQMSQHLYRSSRATKKLLKIFPNGTHDNLHLQDGYWQTLSQFLLESQ